MKLDDRGRWWGGSACRWGWKLVGLGVTAILFMAGLYLVGWLARPDLEAGRIDVSAERQAEAEVGRDVSFDIDDRYSLHRDIKVEPRGESPILADMVEAGQLPPLNERLPERPVVLAGVDGIGNYGGTWMRVAVSPNDVSVINYRLSGPFLVRWSPLGYPIEPHIAESVEPSDDYKVWTVRLREGLRWSDGEPYTADDIMYWWEAEATHPSISATPHRLMQVEDSYGRVEKVNAYEVRFVFDKPFPLFLEGLTQMREPTDTPRHYLEPYHPDPEIGDEATIRAGMAAYQMPSATALYRHLKNFQNPEHPRQWPWIYRTYRSSPPQTFVRNPYYFAVDLEGNQLPYLDRVQFDVQDAKMLALSMASGRASMQHRHLNFADYTELMSRRDLAGTQILHWYNATRGTYVINPNLNRRVEPGDPESKWKAELLAEKRFRQALSLAIDRESIIRSEYLGQGEPAQVAPGPQSDFHHEGLLRAFIEYDPERANALLDELGLDQRDAEGYRTFPDGSRMTWFLDYTTVGGPGPSQFVVDDWSAVGIRVIARQRDRSLFFLERDALTFDFSTGGATSDMMPLISARYYIAQEVESRYAPAWGRWFTLGGYFGVDDAEDARLVPEDHPMYEAMTHWIEARRAPTLEQQQMHMQRVMDLAAENLWAINISTPPPSLAVVKSGFRNVPSVALSGFIFSTPANAGPETYYWENPVDSAGAVDEVRYSLMHVQPMPATRPSDDGGFGGWLRMLLGLLAIVVVTLLAVRHPFIARRFMVLVPTLLVISIVVFVIIQAPPGDFLATRIVQLQETGDQVNMQQIEDLRDLFHFDEPMWKQYINWMGVRWFWTFDSSDMGLLQGVLGRSMETTQPVNEMVGERVMLTMAISFGTILFTWLLAIPIGIFSAVRQYSTADYVLTLVGFVGMCIPPFLLALVLMAVSGFAGLFSPEYAAQPAWDWGKVADLLKHIWIPIVVLGVSGTAGMIRVMRANLLDELNKPYVTTALAKGMRPTRVLLKYPVRLALNPFISGIGELFPQLISGGAIVAMVLALPTVGPLLLAALFNQDMYLAGSMLMVLSLLGVLGTLISDLLLLWLDPRIRYEGGSR